MHNLYNFIVIILVIIIIILLVDNNQQPLIEENKTIKEPFNNHNKNKKYIYLFYSKKCIHSMNFIPIWEKLKTLKDYSNLVEFRDVEETEDEDDEFIKYNIKQMPTIIIQNENERDFTVYKGSRTLEDIVEFLKLKTSINLNKNDLEGFSNFSFDGEYYKVETDKFKQSIHKDFQNTHPLFSLIISFLHNNKNNDNEPLEKNINLLKLKENKDFLKCNKNGICSEIEELKTIYKDSEENMKLINLINEVVCIDDNALFISQ